MDPNAVNYNPEATEDIGGCYYLEDLPCEGESTMYYNGYDYAIIRIGEQCWFAENLRTESYANGDDVPSNLSGNTWNGVDFGASAVYGEGDSECMSSSPDGDACDESWSLNEYGRLYNWYAAIDERNLCPSGWHVPTKTEFEELKTFLSADGHESQEGIALMASYGWASFAQSGEHDYDAYGFSALPSGQRNHYGEFIYAGSQTYFHTSSTAGSAGFYEVTIGESYMNIVDNDDLIDGNPIRCIKD